MRYGKEHKLATRQRIVETAGRRFKRNGIDGSGVATLMDDAGLTNGAFYAHFESKDQLVTTAITDQLHRQAEAFGTYPGDRAGLEQFVRAYLSSEHRDSPADGCPSAALLDEIGRCSEGTKSAFTEGLMVVIDVIATRIAPDDPQAGRMQALSVFASMVGSMQLARALSDRQLSDAVLEQATQNAIALIQCAGPAAEAT